MKPDYSRNVIRAAGNCAPFVYLADDGIHVGDSDNHEIFSALADALAYAYAAILYGDALETARRHADDDARDNEAAEHSWHQDAVLQIAALRELQAVK